MAQVNISLPPALKEHVDEQVALGRYASASDYVRDLIRQEQDREERVARLRAAIDQGWNSPVSTRSLQDIYDADKARRDAA